MPHFSSSASSPELRLFPKLGPSSTAGKASDCRKVEVMEGKPYTGPKAPWASSLMRGRATGDEPQVAGSDG